MNNSSRAVYLSVWFTFILTSNQLLFAQGSLTPPGPPAPTMKSLDEIDAKLEKRTPISSLPYFVLVPGSYYLTTNLTGVAGQHGITIFSSDVSIDLNGFALVGVPGSVDGINPFGPFTNVVVRNGTIRNWGHDGVNAVAGPARDVVLEHLRILNNGSNGITLSVASAVTDCVLDGNHGNGIVASGFLSRCKVRNSSRVGILCWYASQVRDCEVVSTGNEGIYALVSQIIGCRIESSGTIGIFGGSQVRECLVASSATDGIYAAGGDVRECKVDSSGQDGIVGAGVVQNCKVSASQRYGIWVFIGSRVVDCRIDTCVSSGIYETGGRNQIVGNICNDNNLLNDSTQAGISIGGDHNRVEANHVTQSSQAGIRVRGAGNNNVIVKNTVSDNGANNYVVPAGNDLGPVGTAATATSPWANISH